MLVVRDGICIASPVNFPIAIRRVMNHDTDLCGNLTFLRRHLTEDPGKTPLDVCSDKADKSGIDQPTALIQSLPRKNHPAERRLFEYDLPQDTGRIGCVSGKTGTTVKGGFLQ